jgi:hypothetical protein
MGSFLFVAGMVLFFICAGQVYLNKFLKRGTVVGGIYSYIRHPQYLSLAIAGIGLSILWPRLLSVVCWLAMVMIYYFLSRDEERRMLKLYEAGYRQYMERTGMFFPKPVEARIMPQGTGGKAAVFMLLLILTLGSAFILRSYTISNLPVWTGQNVVAMSVLDDDRYKMEHRMPEILQLGEVAARLNQNDRYLVYFLPPHYIMQGLIADTGGDWKLYKQHHTVSMITDWIIHPFSHLSEAHSGMHSDMQHGMHSNDFASMKRLIFLKIENAEGGKADDPFGINVRRLPKFMIDIDIHSLRVSEIKELPDDTGWGTVPTPVF